LFVAKHLALILVKEITIAIRTIYCDLIQNNLTDRLTFTFQDLMTSQLLFNLAGGSASCSFSTTAAKELRAKLDEIVQALKAKSAEISAGGGNRPKAKPIEYQYTGDVFLEIFCNPNIWANPFVAKVLITLRDDRIRLSCEAELTRIIEDVDRFLEECS
jgi:hypothetical protein